MLDKVLATIKQYNMLKAGDKVICALSGGADSMALLSALYELRDELGIELYAAHLNHSIRGTDADMDEEFVKSFCQSLGVELFVKKCNIPLISQKEHIGEEECGRRERYKFFFEICLRLGGGIIATGHHINDRAETVLLNLFRGSGSLKGVPLVRGNIIRPLARVTKKEAEEYLLKKGISWREDYTNKENKYTRNNLRNTVIPLIEKFFPKASEKIAKCEEYAKEDDEYLCLIAQNSGAFCDSILYVEKFLPLHRAVKRRVAIKALEQWGAEVSDSSIDALFSIAEGESGKERNLGNSVTIIKNYACVAKKNVKKCKTNEEIVIKLCENLELSALNGSWRVKIVDKTEKIRDNNRIVILDAEKLGDEVAIRKRKDGDYISPKGMKGKKKLKALFIDLKIPREKRDEITLLAKDGEVLFIPGIRKTNNYSPTENTKKFFIAEYNNE